MSIKNIIFDVGGVFFDIDIHRMKQAFIKLGGLNVETLYSELIHDPQSCLKKFDRGLITAKEFRAILKQKLHIDYVSDERFDFAWNALLPEESFRKKWILLSC